MYRDKLTTNLNKLKRPSLVAALALTAIACGREASISADCDTQNIPDHFELGVTIPFPSDRDARILREDTNTFELLSSLASDCSSGISGDAEALSRAKQTVLDNGTIVTAYYSESGVPDENGRLRTSRGPTQFYITNAVDLAKDIQPAHDSMCGPNGIGVDTGIC